MMIDFGGKKLAFSGPKGASKGPPKRKGSGDFQSPFPAVRFDPLVHASRCFFLPRPLQHLSLGGGFKYFLFSHPILTNIFQMGWNYRPDQIFEAYHPWSTNAEWKLVWSFVDSTGRFWRKQRRRRKRKKRKRKKRPKNFHTLRLEMSSGPINSPPKKSQDDPTSPQNDPRNKMYIPRGSFKGDDPTICGFQKKNPRRKIIGFSSFQWL